MKPRLVLVLVLIALSTPHSAEPPAGLAFEHPDFEITFPHGFLEPVPSTAPLDVPGVTAHQYLSIRGMDICMVWYADFAAPGTNLDSETILVLGTNALKSDAKLKIETEEAYQTNGVNARRLFLTGGGQGVTVYLRQDLMVIGPRLYQFSCGGVDPGTRNLPEIQAFFTSFHPKTADERHEALVAAAGSSIVDEEKAMATAQTLRTIATAWEAFATDVNAYSDDSIRVGATAAQDVAGVIVWDDYAEISYDQLRGMLAPTYITTLPRADAWGNPLSFAITMSEGGDAAVSDMAMTTTSFDNTSFATKPAAFNYLIRSLGADGRESDRGVYRPGEKADIASDIVYSNATFITRPAAMGRVEQRMQEIEREAARAEEKLQRETLARGTPEQRNRVRMQMTVANMRSLATACEAYAVDYNVYPEAGNVAELSGVISPVYIRAVPEKDEWGTPFLYLVSADRMVYRIVSAGADGAFESRSRNLDDSEPRVVDGLDRDLIYELGAWVQVPREAAEQVGAQRRQEWR